MADFIADNPGPKRKTSGLLRAGVGGLLWGIFFCVVPLFEIVLLGAIVWLPLFVLCEWRRANRYLFWPGLALRLLVITGGALLASRAPLKWEDRREVGPFPTNHMTIAELASALGGEQLYVRFPEDRLAYSVTVPEERLSFRRLAGLVQRHGACQ
jgi:hypothetical protein